MRIISFAIKGISFCHQLFFRNFVQLFHDIMCFNIYSPFGHRKIMDWKIKKQPLVLFMAFIEISSD